MVGFMYQFIDCTNVQAADEHSPDMSVGFFFLKDDNPDTQTFTQALRDIAYQLSRKDTAYEKYIASVCGPDSRFASLQSIWRNLFVDYFLQNSSVNCTVYIVLDGMDESYPDSREQFLELMKDIKSETGRGGVQLVMLGRPHLIEEFELVAEMEQVPTIHVTEGHNSEDIMHYIENSIKKSALLRRAPKALQSEIVQKLTSGAGGMVSMIPLISFKPVG